MKEILAKKKKTLESAIDRFNEYKKFVDHYNSTKSLDMYVEFIGRASNTFSEGLSEHYDNLIRLYQNGNEKPLLSNLYDRLLAADEYKNKIADELTNLLREL
jgi:DNA-binding SARP family transcriptional activator